MGKLKTLSKPKKFLKIKHNLKLKPQAGLTEYSPTQELLDETFIAAAVWDCLKNNDPEGVIEIIQTHLNTVNKQKWAKNAHLSRSKLYNVLKSKNPTIRTLAKLIHSG